MGEKIEKFMKDVVDYFHSELILGKVISIIAYLGIKIYKRRGWSVLLVKGLYHFHNELTLHEIILIIGNNYV